MVLFCIIWKWRTNFFVYLLTRDIGAAEHGAREAVAGWPARCRIPETVSQDGGGGVTTALWCQWCWCHVIHQWYILWDGDLGVRRNLGKLLTNAVRRIQIYSDLKKRVWCVGAEIIEVASWITHLFGRLSISGLSSFKNVNWRGLELTEGTRQKK